MILKCLMNCEHDYQDSLYGKGMRVHNPMKGGEKARCTVCGNVRDCRLSLPKSDKNEKDKK